MSLSRLHADSRLVQSINRDWRFHKGDLPLPENAGITITEWQWKPYVDIDGLSAQEWMKGAPLNASIPANVKGGDWEEGNNDPETLKKWEGYTWYKTELPKVGDAMPKYVYFDDLPSAQIMYFNGKLITPKIHQRSWEGLSVPLEGWKKDGPNTLVMLVKRNVRWKGIGKTWLLSPGLANGMDGKTATSGPASTSFDDSKWRIVKVPHDYVIEGSFTKDANPNHAYLPATVGWYRRSLPLAEDQKGKRVWLEFDGVYCNSFLWINGRFIGFHFSGYNSFRYDITDFVAFGRSNEIAMRVDPRQFMGWWYEGGGINRKVRLVVVDPVHIAPWGVQVVSTVANPGDGKTADASVDVRTKIENQSDKAAKLTVRSVIKDSAGTVVANVSTPADVPPQSHVVISQKAPVSSAKLWSPDQPAMYSVHTDIEGGGGGLIDGVKTPFGIRKMEWHADKGLILNGQPIKIKGTCNHADFIGVGTALPDRVQEWRIEKLKELGSNGFRCSHNPVATETLDAADRLGMLVMPENRYLGDSPELLGQLENLVIRDRNHPSIISWSIANEEYSQGSPISGEQGKKMADLVRRLDDRTVTAGMNVDWGKPGSLTFALDVQGFNYSPSAYDGFRKQFPKMPIVASEIASTQSSRGIYENDEKKGYVSAYNKKKAPPEVAWEPIATRPWVAGGFVWTGFEYKGEPSPYKWPNVNSNYGIMDNCGFPKETYYYYKACWSDAPVIHVGGHWNWSGKEGQEIPVEVQSNRDEVEMFLNGNSLGLHKIEPYKTLRLSIPYQPGTLEGRGKKGNETVQHRVETTGGAAAIQLAPDRSVLNADGNDVAMIEVRVVDEQGRRVPTAMNDVTFHLQGPGKILGVGNGDPSSHEPDQASNRRAFNGLAMVLVEAPDNAGEVKVVASSPGLNPGTTSLRFEAIHSAAAEEKGAMIGEQ